ncbi:MAG: hypothetical protein KAT68_04445 [Bacteroidales bacterium]|nr:hypothetical protein [Bacteroidales bacterium]
MFRKALSTLLILNIFVFNLLADNEVELTSNIQSEVKAGSEFTVLINIKKGELENLARFQMDFPAGFTPIPIRSANGDFRFENQVLSIQWMKLPFEEQFSISFNVKVAANVEGYFVLKARFNYIENNKMNKIQLYPHIITVIPLDISDDELIISKQENIDVTDIVSDEISCIRQKPYLSVDNEIIVNLLVTKGNLSKFAKIEEQIPVGYKAVSIKSKNSIFVFNINSQIVKFMWMNLPPDPQYIVSYKLIPINEITDDAFIINGTFIYAENNTTKTIEIVERNINLDK